MSMSNHHPGARTVPTTTPLLASEAEGADHDAVLVLIADDEAPIAETLALMVEEAGYTALLASHGREALELARLHSPSLLITDLMMPYLDGAALIAALRREAAAKGRSVPPIILMTAASGRRAEEAGADATLNKPFDLDEVEELLRQFLGEPPNSGPLRAP